MPKPKRIVCYAINGSGLGHLTRLVAVARWMRRYVTVLDGVAPEIIFLTSSDASDILASARFAAFKIPSKTVATRAQLDKSEYKRLAKHFVWNTLGVFAPDLLVVDTFPSGSFDELFQVLDGPFKKSFIRRDVKPEYAARPIFRSAIRLYDQVVKPHGDSPDMSSSDSEPTQREQVQREKTPPARNAGEVIQFDRQELLSSDEARRQLGVASNHRLVYISAGGGGDPKAEETLTQIASSLEHDEDVHLLIGAGPLYRGKRLSGPRTTWCDSPGVWQYFGALDAAISAGGYNSFHELIYAGVPTLFFPQPKVADDQQARVRSAATSGVCVEIVDHATIRTQLHRILEPEKNQALRDACRRRLPKNGARQCAIDLLRPVFRSDQLEWALQTVTPTLAHRLERFSGGTCDVLADWLVPLAPREAVHSQPVSALRSIIDQLSTSAAREVQEVLGTLDDTITTSQFEHSVLCLLDTLERLESDEDARSHLASEALKTTVAVAKRSHQTAPSQDAASHEKNKSTVCLVVDTIRTLLESKDPRLAPLDKLQLFRMFPRVVDAEIDEARGLFEDFICERMLRGDAPHGIMQQIQVLKMTHNRLTRATLSASIRGASQ